MPNTNNAKKSNRRNEIRREHNRVLRSALRTVIKKCRTAAAGTDAEAAQAAYQLAVKRLDQAAANRLIHKNKAARLKSRLSKGLKPAAAGT
jgi:small subunit ribosomal protein S20